MIKGLLYNQEGIELKKIDLPEEIFGVPFNNDLVHQALVAHTSNSRQPWAHTKTREEISGGGKKPWRQKGTGRARHGSNRSPLWKGGGVTFGPRNERDYSKKINKKMKRKALFMMLTRKNKDNLAVFVDDITLGQAKTKEIDFLLRNFLKTVFEAHIPKKITGKKVLIIDSSKSADLDRPLRNLKWATIVSVDSLNISDLLSYKFIVLKEKSVELLNKSNLKAKGAD